MQVSAAITLLEISLKAVELADIQERLENLEAIAKTHARRGPDDDQPFAPLGKIEMLMALPNPAFAVRAAFQASLSHKPFCYNATLRKTPE